MYCLPDAQAKVRPMIFAMSVLRVRKFFCHTPLSITFISGMPEPDVNE
jgi:hypothetical protein